MIHKIEKYLQSLTIEQFPYTNVIGIARSMLALGTLLTLVFNDMNLLFPTTEGAPLNSLFAGLPFNQFNFFLLLGFAHLNSMKIFAIIILISVIIGYYPQITCLLHWWISLSFFIGSTYIDGGDQITAILSFLLIPLCLSDPRINHWYQYVPRARLWSLFGLFSIFLIRLQIAIIYFDAAVGKFKVEEWSDGTALYYWFYNTGFGMSPWLEKIMYPLLVNNYFVTATTYGVMIFELTLFLALTMPTKYRKWLLPVALSFHFFIIIFHGIFSFFFGIGAGVVLYLFPSYEHIKVNYKFQQFFTKTPIYKRTY